MISFFNIIFVTRDIFEDDFENLFSAIFIWVENEDTGIEVKFTEAIRSIVR